MLYSVVTGTALASTVTGEVHGAPTRDLRSGPTKHHLHGSSEHTSRCNAANAVRTDRGTLPKVLVESSGDSPVWQLVIAQLCGA